MIVQLEQTKEQRQTTTFWKGWWWSINNMSCFRFLLCDSTLKYRDYQKGSNIHTSKPVQ